MKVSFKESSMHGYMYRQIYNRMPSEESNLCNYFWKIMGILVGLPFLWVNLLYPVSLRNGGYWQAILTGVLTYVGSAYTLMMGDTFSEKRGWELTVWQDFFVGVGMLVALILVVVIGIAAIVAIGAGIGYTYQKVKSSEDENDETDSLIVAKFKAFKGKYCPKIDWK